MYFLWTFFYLSCFLSLQASENNIFNLTVAGTKPTNKSDREFLQTIFPDLPVPCISQAHCFEDALQKSNQRGYPLFVCLMEGTNMESLTKKPAIKGIQGISSTVALHIPIMTQLLRKHNDVILHKPTFCASFFAVNPDRENYRKPSSATFLTKWDWNNPDKLNAIIALYEREHAREILPENPTLHLIKIYHELGNEYINGKHKDWDLAIRFFNLSTRKAIDNRMPLHEHASCQESLNSIAEIFRNRGNFEAAREWYQRGIEMGRYLKSLSGLLELWLYHRPDDYTTEDCHHAFQAIEPVAADLFPQEQYKPILAKACNKLRKQQPDDINDGQEN